MKEKNNIDELFKSKMNNQTFELKDAYLADFETKLDAYNKKGKGLFWFLFGGMVLFTCFYDFAILPKLNNKQTYSIVKVVPFHKIEGYNSTNALQTASYSAIMDNSENDRIINSRNTKNTLETANSVSKNKVINKNKSLNNIAVQTNKNRQNSTNNNKTTLNSDIEHKIAAPINENKNSFDSTAMMPTLKEEQEPETIYLDDTIRRKVVVIDTVIQRDTVVINDTIKNRIRLFKKKR